MSTMRLTTSLLVMSALTLVGIGQTRTAGFTEPRSGVTIANRLNFPVVISVGSYDKDKAAGFDYWVSIASGQDRPAMHWPKFYVKQGFESRAISDGGSNPLPSKQPMTLLLLRVDRARTQQFELWFDEGQKPGGTYPGLSVVLSEVVASVPIFFP